MRHSDPEPCPVRYARIASRLDPGATEALRPSSTGSPSTRTAKAKSVRGREIVPRTLIGHGFGTPLEPRSIGGRSPDAISFSVSDEPRNWQNYPCDGRGLTVSRQTHGAPLAGHALARQTAMEAKKARYSLCGIPLWRIMPDQRGDDRSATKEAKSGIGLCPRRSPQFDTEFQSTFAELLAWRRDVRRFRSDEAPDEATLAELFALAALAPSVGNCQPTRFVRVDDEARRASIRANFEAANQDALVAYGGERPRFTPNSSSPA